MVFAIFRFENFRVRPGIRVKPQPPIQDKLHMKKGWDYTRVSTVFHWCHIVQIYVQNQMHVSN